MSETRPYTVAGLADDVLAYSIPQAARAISVSPTTLKKLISTGKLKATKVTEGRTVVRRDELVRYLDACAGSGTKRGTDDKRTNLNSTI